MQNDTVNNNKPHPADIMLSVVAGTIGSIGLPGNLFLIFLILSKYKNRKSHEWLLFALAIGDFFLCLNNAFLESAFITNFARVECKVAGAMEYSFGVLSFFTPPMVAYNRYLSLYDSQKCTRVFTNRNICAAYAVILMMTLAWTSPSMITGSLGKDDVGLCGAKIVTIMDAVALIAVDVMIMISYNFLAYFSYKVVVKIRNHKRDATSQSQFQSRLIDESREIITVMLILSIIPLFVQLPLPMIKLIHVFAGPFDPWMVRLMVAPFPLTSTVNAYITLYVVREYRKKVVEMFKKFSYHLVGGAPTTESAVGPWVTS